MTCARCGKQLSYNEIGLNKKFNANAKQPLCIDCLGEKLGVEKRRLEEKIEEFLRAGCLLFVKAE